MYFLLDFWEELKTLTVEMAPYLILGFLFAGILYAWFPTDKMNRYLGKNNSASAFNAALLGIPLPLCSCGVIPTGVSFYKNGASRGSAVSFLISTPQTGVDSIMVTWSLLGWPMAIIRPVIALFTGVFGGILTNKMEKKENGLSNNKTTVSENPKTRVGVFGMLKYAFGDFLEDIVKWLVIGLIIAALISVIIPQDFFLRYISNDYLSMLIILIASIPLYVCATGSVPIAAVLMMKGLSPGAAIIFLMAGPATNAATISVIGNSMGRKTLTRYLISIIGGALFFGILVNEFLPREWFTSTISGIQGDGHTHKFLPEWIELLSALLLTLAIANGIIKKYILPLFTKRNNSKLNTDPLKMNSQIKVEGMTCNHCKANVENGIKSLKGVKDVNIDLSSGAVSIEGDNIDLLQIKKTVNDLGYKFVD